MTAQITSRDIQRVTFVENFHKLLKKQEVKLAKEHAKFSKIAASYLLDGLTESECVELLMVDGISREAAEGYTAMAQANGGVEEGDPSEYSFQFEDSNGEVFSSYDIGKTIHALSEDEAWLKAQKILSQSNMGADKILSISRID